MHNRIFVRLSFATLLLAACGGDSDSASRGASFADISSSIESPTGTVDADTAPAVAMEFEAINESGGAIPKQSSATQTQQCPAGGNLTVEAQGNQSAATANLSFNDCCYEASCCIGGGGTWYFSNESGAGYSYCGSYDLNVTCGSDNAGSVSYEGCFGLDGSWVYVVRVNGQSFAVTGNYSAGNGTLTIKGANGEYTCTYSNDMGSCTGGSGSFDF